MGMYVASTMPPKNRVFERVRTRKLDRSVAHARMKRAGLEQVNKHENTRRFRIDSYFSTHWREVANKEMNNM